MAEDLEQDHSPNGADEEDKGESTAQQADAQLLLNTHYVKDLSFENPNAPLIYAEVQKGPDLDVNIDVQVRHLQERLYEVMLATRVKASPYERYWPCSKASWIGLTRMSTTCTTTGSSSTCAAASAMASSCRSCSSSRAEGCRWSTRPATGSRSTITSIR